MKYNKRDSTCTTRTFVLCDLRPLLSCCRWTEGLLGPGLLLQRGLCPEPILSDRAGPRRNPPPETKA